MFIITNREIDESKKGLSMIGSGVNSKGPNELRVVEVTNTGKNLKIKILPDVITKAMKNEIDIKTNKHVYASTYAAKITLNKIQNERKNLMLFVHGFNNDFKSIISRTESLANAYNMEVIAFSWPANGGGIKGVVSYKSDKRDAKASVGALDRVLEKTKEFLEEFNTELRTKVYEKAEADFENNNENRNKYITKQMDKGCPFTVNMMLHSMGNYLYKHLLLSSVYSGNKLIFDNIILAAADANNKDHRQWVDKIQARKRVYITINENDFALKTSRMKSGEEQLARLGHYPYNLASNQSVYVDFTETEHVGDSHAYFEGDVLENKTVHNFFNDAFNGLAAENNLVFNSEKGMFEV
jgi:esterase/lipase superfamily enzyme